MARRPEITRAGAALTLCLALAACGAGSTGQDTGRPGANQPPAISGHPPTAVRAGERYDFTPVASDPDGDRLSFSIGNKPAWAVFDPDTGRLHGTPGASDIGRYEGIQITVTDGRATSRMSVFAVFVVDFAMGSVTLSWTPPTTNADGSALTDLAGYRVYYGTSQSAMTRVSVIGNPGLTRWVIDDLTLGTWYFAMTSVNAAGIESARSGTVSRTLG